MTRIRFSDTMLTSALLACSVLSVTGARASGTLKMEAGPRGQTATLTLPSSSSALPLVFMVGDPGSSGEGSLLLKSGFALADQGIATIRPRWSSFPDTDLWTSRGLADWVEVLREDPRFVCVVVLGLGALADLALETAWLADADGFCLLLEGEPDPLVEANRRLGVPLATFDSDDSSLQELGGFVISVAKAAPSLRAARQRALIRAAKGQALLERNEQGRLLRQEVSLPIPLRLGNWARRFAAEDGRVRYLFGLAPGGYAAEGELVADLTHDCVSLLYRCSELARARDADDAVRWALRTRFAGANPDSLVAEDGRVDYGRTEHLDYSLDMIRSGFWGRNITGRMAGAVTDTLGTSRFPASSFTFVPGGEIDFEELAEGDVVWFVLDPDQSARRDHGLVIGHIGLIVIDTEGPVLIHAASKDLSGVYRGGSVVSVPLLTYLARVDRFVGVMVTRFPGGWPGPGEDE